MLRLMNPRNWFAGSSTGSAALTRREGVQFIGPMISAGDQAGQPVNFDTAMQLSSFWASARLWSEVVASLPFCVKRMEGERWVRDDSHWLYRLFYGRRPNRYQNRIEFFETVMLNHVVFGNSFCLIERRPDGTVSSLLPLNSAQVTVELLKDGTVTYHYHNEGSVVVLASESIWHWKLLGNSIVGLSPIDYAKNSVGAGLAADKRSSRLMRTAGKPPGFFTIDKALKPEQREQVRKNFERLQAEEREMAAVLEAGFDFKRVGLSSADLQLLESRRFQVEDVARFMDVPSVLINDTTNSTSWGTGISEIIRGWYKKSVRHRVNSLEESMRMSLLRTAERESVKIEHDFNDLLKLDRAERVKADQTSVNLGSMTPNEARVADGRERVEDPAADRLYFNSALMPIDQAATGRRPNARVDMIEDEGSEE